MIGRNPFFFGVALLVLVVCSYAVVSCVFGKSGYSRSIIGVITIKDEILDSRPTLDLLKKIAEDKSIKAVVIRIDSPGGGVAASQEIYASLRDLGKTKPVVASLGAMATSGGYYVACGAGRIVANPGTLTGSISAVMLFHNVRGLLDKVGVKSSIIKSGRYKDIGSPLRDMRPEEIPILQALVDDVSEQFITVISESRNISRARVADMADGRIFTGRQAKANGLVDELGGINESIRAAARLANVTEDVPAVYFDDDQSSWGDFLADFLSRNVAGRVRTLSRPELSYL